MSIAAPNGIPNFGDVDSDVVLNVTPTPTALANYSTGQGNLALPLASTLPSGLTGLVGATGRTTTAGVAPEATATYAAYITGLKVAAAGFTGSDSATNQAMRDVLGIMQRAGFIRFRGYGVTLYVQTLIGSAGF